MDQERRSLNSLGRSTAGVVVLGIATMLAGCHAPDVRPDVRNFPAPAPAPPTGSAESSPALSPPISPFRPLPPPLARENHLSPATRSLVTQARTQINRGDLDGASSTLDRALRIEPNNPLLWVERGRLRLDESDARQAENQARKALALASGDHAALAQAGRLLADALRAQQRNQEAIEIERQPYMR